MAARSNTWRDSMGRSLADYPRPSIAVDTALLTVDTGLAVLLVRRDSPGGGGRRTGIWGLPGTFLHESELLADAVLRSLRDKAGVTGRSPEQLHVFDRLNRDDRGRVLSVAHLDVVPLPAPAPDPPYETQGTCWAKLEDLPKLAYDHAEIVQLAADRVRAAYDQRPDPYRLLPGPFSLRQLQDLHESVLGESVARDTFRRHMREQLRPVNRTTEGRVGKPAQLFQIRGRSRGPR